MDFWKRAQELKDEITQNRRRIHQNAEVGLNLPNTKAFVMEKLREYGLKPTECGHGVTATLGEPFACPTGETAHACGHDMHTAMLLTAAKMLKENEDALCGTVKLMFQPAEETFEGARDMLENELLENPPVDAALAYHVAAGKSPVGFVMYNDSGVMMASVDGFEVTVHGRGSHGANPNLAIDPINVGVHIHLALQELIARESDPTKTCVLTIGQFMAGTAANIIPDTAVLRGTIRTNDKKARALLVRRMRETAERTAAVYNATVEIRTLSEVCPLVCDKSVTDDMLRYMGLCPCGRTCAERNDVPWRGLHGRARTVYRAQPEGRLQRGRPPYRRGVHGALCGGVA